MSEEPKISVIIPVYNVELYLERCLDSVINQSYKTLEIICVNDGSTDNSLQILKEYQKKDDRIIVVEKENGGSSSARNVGIKKMTGKYVIFVDSDDWIEKDAIKNLYTIIKRENVDVVRGSFFINYDENSSKFTLKVDKTYYTNDSIFENEVFVNFLTGESPCYVWLFMIKASIIKEKNILFREDVLFMEDAIFIINLLIEINSIYFIDYSFYHYFVNDNGLTKSSQKYMSNIECMPKIFEITKEMLSNSKFNSIEYIERKKNAIAKIVMSYVYLLFKSAKNKQEYVEKLNIILNNSTIKNFLEDSNIVLLNKNFKNFVEDFFRKILINKKYNLLYFLYQIRNKIGK